MALIGDLTIYKQIEDKENPIEQVIETAEGETRTLTQYPIIDNVKESIKDAYVIVNIASLQILDYDRLVLNEEGVEVEIETPRGETKEQYRVFYQYNIYSSKEARQDKFYEPYLEMDNDTQILVSDLNLGGKNIIEFCYDHLKTKKGFENLLND